MLNVHLRCTVEICRHGCPDHCSKLPPPPGTHIADVHGQFSDNEPIAVQSQVSQTKVKPNSIEEHDNEGPEEIEKEKPDIHREAIQAHQAQQHSQQQHQSSEEMRRPIQIQHQQQPSNQPNQQPPVSHQRPPQFQHPPLQHQGPPLRYPSQPPPEGFNQFPPQMMHPPPPRGYFGRGPHTPPGAPPPMPPGMFRQPPRKLIPPGLVRQRPDISSFQHNVPNLRHHAPPNMAVPQVFPSQQNMFRENMPPQEFRENMPTQEQAMLEQHRKQAERVQSMILPPEHKDELNNNEEIVARQGEPQKDADATEEEEVDADNENAANDEESQDDIKAEQLVQEKEENEPKPEQVRNISQPQALKGIISDIVSEITLTICYSIN